MPSPSPSNTFWKRFAEEVAASREPEVVVGYFFPPGDDFAVGGREITRGEFADLIDRMFPIEAAEQGRPQPLIAKCREMAEAGRRLLKSHGEAADRAVTAAERYNSLADKHIARGKDLQACRLTLELIAGMAGSEPAAASIAAETLASLTPTVVG